MPALSPLPDDSWLHEQLDACTRVWPDHTNFRINKAGSQAPLYVLGDSKDPARGASVVLLSIDHPEAWSLLGSMLWGS